MNKDKWKNMKDLIYIFIGIIIIILLCSVIYNSLTLDKKELPKEERCLNETDIYYGCVLGFSTAFLGGNLEKKGLKIDEIISLGEEVCKKVMLDIK